MRALLVTLSLAFGAGAQPGPSPTAQAEAARTAFATGLKAYDKGDLAGAEAQFRGATQLMPEWALAQLYLGITLLTADPHNSEAVQVLERAAAADPKNPRARLQLGLAYERTGRLVDAGRELREALELRGDLTDARIHLASVVAQLGPASEAIELYLQLLESQPNDLSALAALADLYEHTSQLALAETALLSIVRLYPDVTYHRYQLAQFYQRTGEQKKAAKVFAELERRQPKRQMRRLR